jgi:Glycosyltransferases involved in cell wall biogenesis
MDIKKIEQPLVSVIVPSYNHAHYITQCIESIIQQSYKNFELVVIDDGSKDDTRTVLEALHLKYNFTLVFQENHGVAYTLNRGIKEFAKGKYLTFCASDDYWALDKLEKQVQFMEANQFYPMCYGRSYFVDERSVLIEDEKYYREQYRGGNIFDDILLFKFQPPVNYLFRKSIFAEVGYYDEKIFAEDYYMNLIILSKYPIGFIDDYLGYYRLTDSQNKIIGFDRISDSHLMSIENFKNHPLYKRAQAEAYVRKFNTFAPYKVYKLKALVSMFKSRLLIKQKLFWMATCKLLLFWKNID